MLKHRTIGPTAAGGYLVVYPTPGCDVPTTVCSCATADQAATEARRLNRIQRAQARAEQNAQALREWHRRHIPWSAW
jgi:hypothetical protein